MIKPRESSLSFFNYIPLSSKKKKREREGGEEPLSNYSRLNYIKWKKNPSCLKLCEREVFAVFHTWKTSVTDDCHSDANHLHTHRALTKLFSWFLYFLHFSYTLNISYHQTNCNIRSYFTRIGHMGFSPKCNNYMFHLFHITFSHWAR